MQVFSRLQRSSLVLPILAYVLPVISTSVPIVSCSIDQPQLFTNPSFEDGDLTGWTYTSSDANPVVYNVDSSSSTFATAADGMYYLDTKNSSPRGGDFLFLHQTVDGLNTSMTYTISYSIAAGTSSFADYCYIYIFKDSQANANLLTEDIIQIPTAGLSWTEYSVDFQPTAESHVIFFLPECDATAHVGFDNVELLQPKTSVCSTSYSTVALPSSTPSGSAVLSTPAVSSPVTSSEAMSSSLASSNSPSPVRSSSPLASASTVPQTVLTSLSNVSPSSKSTPVRSTPAGTSPVSVKSSSTSVSAFSSQSKSVTSSSSVRSASQSPSDRVPTQSVSTPHRSNYPSSVSISSFSVTTATSKASNSASISPFNTSPAASGSSSQTTDSDVSTQTEMTTEVINAETTGYTKTADNRISGVAETIVATATVVWESGHLITKTHYYTVTECPEAEKSSSTIFLPVTAESEALRPDTSSSISTTLQKFNSAHYAIGTSQSTPHSTPLVASSSSASATTSSSAVYTGLALSRMENQPSLPILIGGVFMLANFL